MRQWFWDCFSIQQQLYSMKSVEQTYNGDHPHHDVGVEADPEHGAEEGKNKPRK